MTVTEATDQQAWDFFLSRQQFRPFLQSWTMGEVYRDTQQEPIRLEVHEDGEIVAICQAIVVPAKRGRHLSIPYGPLVSNQESLDVLLQELKRIARQQHCTFMRMSPFLPAKASAKAGWPPAESQPSPLHLLAEHLWYLPLQTPDPWQPTQTSNEQRATSNESPTAVIEESLLKNMRKTTRNLVRRAERDGVTIETSSDPNRDIEHFLALHEETRQRHGFTPYTHEFFRSQIRRFSERGECTVYLARYQGEIAAASIHMHAFGETSYHHGASTHRLSKVPASYLLQWTAIRDALRRGDRVYNFWGIAPLQEKNDEQLQATSYKLQAHPFAGVTLFKTGFGGSLLPLTHCVDFPLSARYHLTRAFELLRKWRRGF
ncbi:MAG: peptidoglycan bridge formation glycyltransferase FemA/FemB family protein [Candidatus Peregrinibacteria bacterium]